MSDSPRAGRRDSNSINVVRRSTSSYRSCHTCHRRKIRCDKREPCSACSRGHVACEYPPADERIKRPRKTTMASVAHRLSDLERRVPPGDLPTPDVTRAEHDVHSLSHSVSRAEGEVPSHAHGGCSVDAVSMENQQAFGSEILVQQGSRSRYISEGFLARVIEKQQDIQSVLSTPQADRDEPDEILVSKPIAIFPPAQNSWASSVIFPSNEVGLKLWSVYVERIDSCTSSKILHIPTDEVRVCSAIDKPNQTSTEDLAFCFAIFYAAIMVLRPSEARDVVGGDVAAAQARFKAGLEQSLAEVEILDHPTLTLLRALSIYLAAFRQCSTGNSVWVLDGLALRMAQSIGFHRNGERLKLSPFESELRRRVWWHLLAFDSQTAQNHGIQKLCNLRSDANLPLNVNDADLYPDMDALPPPKPGLTAMTFSLVGYHIVCTENRLEHIVASATPSKPPDEALRLQIITETRDHIEKWLQECNPVVPRQRVAILASRLAIRKVDLTSRQQWLALHHRGCCDALTTEENLVDALEMLEIVLDMRNDRLLEPYSWMWKSHPEYDATMYLLWHLCTRSEGPNIERAWQIVDRLFEPGRDFESSWGSRRIILSTLMAKAEKIRSGERERPLSASPCRQADPQLGTGTLLDGPAAPRAPAQDPDLDWGLFAEAFQLDQQLFPNDMTWDQTM